MTHPPSKPSRPAPGQQDKRAASRRDVTYRITIELLADGRQLPCTIQDVSETGARLSLAAAGEVPETFILRLGDHPSARRHCRVVWRKESTIGVAFVLEGA